LKKFSGVIPLDPVKTGREDIEMEKKGRHGRKGTGREEWGKAGRGRGRKGRRGGKRVVPPRFPWAGYGPVSVCFKVMHL
jgi:hypothetical protein